MLNIAMEYSLKKFEENELNIEIFLMTALSPICKEDLTYILDKGTYFVTLEEGTKSFGWGAEIVASIHEYKDNVKTKRCAAEDSIIPSSEIGENTVLPSLSTLINTI